MKTFAEMTEKNRAADAVRRFLSSRFYPFVIAAVTISCYYLGWDLVTMYVIAATGIAILLICRDVSPLIANFLFMNVMISKVNSPSYTVGGSDYYFRTAVVAQVIVIISLFALAAVYKIVVTGAKKRIKPTPTFYGLCALAAAFVLNGAAADDYDPMNLVYGIFMAFFFLAVFVLMKDNVKPAKDTFEKIALSFLALSIVLLCELTVAYVTTEDLFLNGVFYRNKLAYGWGVWNTMGMLLVLCLPSVTYLAGKYRYGFLLTVYSVALYIGAIMSGSRQAMIGASVIYPVCLIILFVKGKRQITNLLIIAAAAIAGIVAVGLNQDAVFKFFTDIFDNFFIDGKPNGSSRWELWTLALENFKSSPIFGVGFYTDLPQAAEMVGLDIIPLMYHNTFMQLMGSCGILGLAAYAVHRVQTAISYFKNITTERTFIAVTVIALLFVNLFDNHLFYILPTLVYSSLISVLIATEKKTV